MTELPSRLQAARDRLVFALLGGAGAGVVDTARELNASKLFLSAAELTALFGAGVLSGALFGIMGGVLLLPLPRKPLGRTRWLAFLCGGAAVVATAASVVILTDAPPFQEPPWYTGNPLAFAALGGGLLVAVLGLYQAVRGAQSVATTAMGLAAAGGVWAWQGESAAAVASAAPPPGAPNVLIVTLDTVRADHFGAMGNRTIDTRHFDALAAEGTLFRSAAAVAAVTGPSHAAMFTGTGPWENGVLLNGVPLPSERKLLSEHLQSAGYRTGAFVSAYVLEGPLGFSRGFSVYDDDFGWMPGATRLLASRVQAIAHRHDDPDDVLERRGRDTTDRALAWIGQQQAPWYAWVHLFDAHGPYEPPPPYDTRYYSGDPRDPSHTSMSRATNVAQYLKASLLGITDLDYVLAQYAGEISYLDEQLGRLLEAVPADTMVVVIGDHGESFGEHGVWFNHGDDVHEASVHVPFVIRYPGKVPKAVVDTPVSGADVAPTVLSLLGLPTDGMSGVNVISTPRVHAASLCFDRDTNVAERKAGRVTKPKWRLASLRSADTRYNHREFDGAWAWFDLAADPTGINDLKNVVEADPVRSALPPILAEEAKALYEGDTSRSGVELSAEERARLEMLGYLEPL